MLSTHGFLYRPTPGAEMDYGGTKKVFLMLLDCEKDSIDGVKSPQTIYHAVRENLQTPHSTHTQRHRNPSETEPALNQDIFFNAQINCATSSQ